MYAYGPVLGALEDSVRASYARQVLDRDRPDRGAFISERHGCASADHTANAADLAAACYAFLAEGSPLEGDESLFERIQLSAGFQRRWQRPSGLIDLVNYNWESPPDTAFTVQLLCPVAALARRRAEEGDERARRIAESLGEYVRTAAQGAVGRGFQTPNHRWVVCSALAQAMTLFPDLAAGDYVASILAESVDMNADGEYTERSTGVYDSVCNRSLRLMADHLGKPELLDPVRRNLDLMVHLLHPDGTIVTTTSRRQDRGQRVVPVGAADSFFDMAQRDRNGVWAAVADMLVAEGPAADALPWLMQPFAEKPEYRDDSLEREPLPDDFRKLLPAAGLWRVRRGLLSATAAAGSTSAFAVHCGEARLKAVKIAGTYASTARFEADALDAIDGGVRLLHEGGKRTTPGYSLPLRRPVPWGEFGRTLRERERWTPPALDQILEIREVEDGFHLHLRTQGGLDRVPFQIECCFEGPGEWETEGQVAQVQNGQTAILKSGHGVFRRGDHWIRIGPGSASHRMWHMRDTEPETDSFRVLIALQAPIDQVFEIRYGPREPAAVDLQNQAPAGV